MKTDFFYLKNFIIKRHLKAFFICVNVFGYCHAQVHQLKNSSLTSTHISFISNNKIDYSIVLLSCDTCVPISNIGLRVKVNLTKKEREIAKGLNTGIWLSLLENSRTDWAANLILYDSDHLWDTRLTFDSFSGTATTTQQTDYMPFGMEVTVGSIVSPKNKYLYNGKELQSETGLYDYGARFFDPEVARWTSIDPLTEESRRWSPYNYGENNPIRNIDPDGMMVTDADGS